MSSPADLAARPSVRPTPVVVPDAVPDIAPVESQAGPAADAPLPPAVIGSLSLSPSRAADFKSCPLLYRFRSIDRLPETPTRDALRGTVVHAVLERLYDLPAPERTVANAQAAVAPAFHELVAAQPELGSLFGQIADPEAADTEAADTEAESAELAAWLDSARALVANYFTLEDPTRLEPAGREQLVEVVLDGLRLRGYIDRLDVSPAGDIRVVDYKTGSTPREAFEAKALFQMKFYALVLWRTRGVVPRQLRLIYLADSDTLSYQPTEDELARFERTVQAIWKAIATASLTGDFRPNPSRLCDWCSHQQLCPAKGGTPPPFPAGASAGATADQTARQASACP